MLCSYKIGWNLAIWDNMDGPMGYCAKWNNSDWENAKWFHLCVESKKMNKQTKSRISLINAENKLILHY